MRFFLLLFLLSSAAMTTVRPQSLAPGTTAPLIDHLRTVNPFWAHHPTGAPTVSTRFADDRERIQQHLRLVTRHLRHATPALLPPEQLRLRSRLLDVLSAYAEAGRFPRNTHHPERRTPYFVDNFGTACAVGYLLLASGETELVDRIHRERNNAYLPELATAYLDIGHWARAHGFAPAELAWIQPGYDFRQQSYQPEPLGNNLGLTNGIVRDIEVYAGEAYFAGDFTSIDGLAAQSIAAWDGTSFRALPGLSGRIDHLAIDEPSSEVYAAGSFPGLAAGTDTALVVRYRNATWTPLLFQSDLDADAELYDLLCIAGSCYLAGAIDSLGTAPAGPLLVWSNAEAAWSVPAGISLTGTIYDLDGQGERLLLGGDFELPDGSRNIALLNLDSNVLSSFEEMFPDIDRITHVVFNNYTVTFGPSPKYLFVGLGTNGSYYQGVGTNGLWSISEIFFDAEQSFIHGLDANSGLIYGTLRESDGPTIPLYNITDDFGTTYDFPQTDGGFTAMATFGDLVITAGTFTSLDGEPINQLAIGSLLVPNEDPPAPAAPEVSSDGRRLFVRHLPTKAPGAQLELFDLNGRLLSRRSLPVAATQWIVPGGDLPSGIYLYRLTWAGRSRAGKVLLGS